MEQVQAIREEIRRIESGEWPQDNNPLKNAPHTAQTVVADSWNHPYSRQTATATLSATSHAKYWAPVGRLDNVYGDRHLSCSCIPVSEFA